MTGNDGNYGGVAEAAQIRKRYLETVRASAEPWLFPVQRRSLKIVPATLGELS